MTSPASSPASSPRRLLGLGLALSAAFAAPARAQTAFRFAREGVLGSSSVLEVLAADAATAARADAAVHAEVVRLAAIVSTWDAGSELAQLQRAGGGEVSAELAEVLGLAAHWRAATGGAFEPGVTALAALWTGAAGSGTEPSPAALAAAVAALREPAFTLVGRRLEVAVAFTLDGIAKGFLVDRAAAAVASVAGASLVSFQIGGDTRIGPGAATIALADPRQPAANGTPLRTLRLGDRGVASSGGYHRGFDVGGRHHSHILDPRSGRPCDAVLGASVVAPEVATADALATALCVLGPEAGFRILAKVPDAHAVLVTADGTVHESPGFAALVAAPAAAPPPAPPEPGAWPTGFALQVQFTIRAPAAAGTGRRGGWKRPYVAVWIEDVTGAPARTLCLWLEDRRWLRDLRRWSRQHADDERLVDVVSQATRKAGEYTLTWDGTDAEGRTLAPGRYTVLIEVAREHGTYQLVKQPVDLGRQAFAIDLEDNEELTAAKVRFDKPKAKGT